MSKYGFPPLIFTLLLGVVVANYIPGFDFDYPVTTLRISELALAIIIFAGGFNTHPQEIKSAILPGFTLSSIGVLLTTFLGGIIFYFIFNFSLYISFLLSAIVSSTDAAAVFSIFSTSTSENRKLIDIIKFESGSNDPIAYFLVIALTEIMMGEITSLDQLVLRLAFSIIIASLTGIIATRVITLTIDKTRIEPGQTPILILVMVIFLYSLNSLLGGNPFLAVYISGLLFDRIIWDNKAQNQSFLNNLSWFMELVLFLILGLQVYFQPSPISFFHQLAYSLSLYLFLDLLVS